MLTTQFVPGAPVWLDLTTKDVNAAAAFYGSLFGWEHRSMGPEAGDYGMFQLDGRTVAAVGPYMQDGDRTTWTLYFRTDDADRTVKTVEQAGGTMLFEPVDVFDFGRMAGCADPAGATFHIWEPREYDGLETVTDPGSLCWTELHTSDGAGAKEFYRAVFDWNFEDMPLDEGMTYTVVSPSGGGQESAQGGIMELPPESLGASSGPGPAWLPYFEVGDCDATVEQAARGGARVTMPATDMEGVGRVAMLTDPGGASFAVIRSVEMG
jgi:predicted enzyme related to lactoylglutathione lyase